MLSLPETEGEALQAPPQSGPSVEPWSWTDYLIGMGQRMTLLFLLYVLSIGPMYWRWYSSKFVNGSPYVAAFYEPLWRLTQRFDWFGEWVDFYIRLWGEWKF